MSKCSEEFVKTRATIRYTRQNIFKIRDQHAEYKIWHSIRISSIQFNYAQNKRFHFHPLIHRRTHTIGQIYTLSDFALRILTLKSILKICIRNTWCSSSLFWGGWMKEHFEPLSEIRNTIWLLRMCVISMTRLFGDYHKCCKDITEWSYMRKATTILLWEWLIKECTQTT